ncbi:hypothetical protein [uncultured Aquimarina sp.]|uniref:hypothetical protein n=1 Tax=uncultured Aquimarina sp. TaxID=575652 RepID=UPI0026079C84|nr:hypothetical protein [uncultured Aquimarina sp.]
MEPEHLNKKDKEQIDLLTKRFFDLFTNTDDKIPNVKALKSFFIKEGIIINNSFENPLIYNLDNFITPREEILTNGTLTDFREHEISEKTEIFRNIAQRFCHYKKSGKLNEKPFTSEGMKTIQFIKTANQWKISSVTWSDIE